MSRSLFAKVVAASGLSPIFAEGSLSRAMQRVGVDPATMSPADLGRCLGEVERVLSTFYDPEEVATRMMALRRLAG